MIKTCVICGKEFDARNSAITCSPECSESRHNSIKRNPAEDRYLRHFHSLMRRKMWLTIPDAPNYEIDSKLNVRNKKTGHIRKPTIRNGTKYYSLPTVAGQRGCPKLSYSAITYRRQAVSAYFPHSFEPIPSLGGKYEINSKGVVRNSVTKKIVRSVRNAIQLWDSDNKIPIIRSIPDLLWEVNGVYKKKFRPVPVWAEHRSGKFFFKNSTQCARFLDGKLPYKLTTLMIYLWRRSPTIGDWAFSYVDENPDNVKWAQKKLDSLARRQKKMESTP